MRRYRGYKRQERKPEQRIEFPSMGSTYCHQKYGVYEYGEYPRSSVLAGMERRVFLDSFETLAEAQKAYPAASYNGLGSGFQEVSLNHLPDPDGPDPLGDNQDAAEEMAREALPATMPWGPAHWPKEGR
jgi:hypothetical protein